MLRALLAATLFSLLVFCFISVQPVQAQLIWEKSLTAASLSDLPVHTETYQAGGNTFTWTFDWDNVYTLGTIACVYPQVVQSSMGFVEICNSRFNTGHRQFTGGPVGTGYPSDYLQITKQCSSPCDVISNMVFKVNYKTGTPSMPGQP
jgi:hypothetical protein